MDFGVVGLDSLLSATAPSSNNGGGGGFGSVADADVSKYGSGFLKRESTVDEDDLRAFKLAKTSSSCPKIPNNSGGFCSANSQMLSFSSHNAVPFYPHASSAINGSAGYSYGGVNATNIHGVRGLFTASQWMELEQQALIYKYIMANVPIPSYLLNPIRKVGWGADFHLRFSNTDPEPGRCRRTDGKKWRCSRDAVPDQKYCERHMNRGRHRSRKPVEGQSGHSASGPTGKPTLTAPSVGGAAKSLTLFHHPGSYAEPNRPEFGSVCSDSLLNPLHKTSSSMNDGTLLSISITPDEKRAASPLRLSITSEQSQREINWVPVSWEPSIGGPLGEALHTTSNGMGECKNSRALNLIENWDHRGPYSSVSNSSAGSSPRAESSKTTLDGPTFYNGLIGPGLMLPSLPAL